MKSLFKTKLLILILLITNITQLQASVITIYHHDNSDNARTVARIFQKKYSIPSGLIKIVKSVDCVELSATLLEMCINKKGELITLSSNISLFKRSINVFNNP